MIWVLQRREGRRKGGRRRNKTAIWRTVLPQTRKHHGIYGHLRGKAASALSSASLFPRRLQHPPNPNRHGPSPLFPRTRHLFAFTGPGQRLRTASGSPRASTVILILADLTTRTGAMHRPFTLPRVRSWWTLRCQDGRVSVVRRMDRTRRGSGRGVVPGTDGGVIQNTAVDVGDGSWKENLILRCVGILLGTSRYMSAFLFLAGELSSMVQFNLQDEQHTLQPWFVCY